VVEIVGLRPHWLSVAGFKEHTIKINKKRNKTGCLFSVVEWVDDLLL